MSGVGAGAHQLAMDRIGLMNSDNSADREAAARVLVRRHADDLADALGISREEMQDAIDEVASRAAYGVGRKHLAEGALVALEDAQEVRRADCD